MQTFFFNENVIIVLTSWTNTNYLELIDQKIHTPNENIGKTVVLYDCFNIIFQTLFQNGDAKGRWCIGGGINVPVNVTLKANKSQAKEIKRLLIQKKMEVVLTSMDDNNAEYPENNTVEQMICCSLFWTQGFCTIVCLSCDFMNKIQCETTVNY